MKLCLSFLVLVLVTVSARADDSFAAVSEKVNRASVERVGSPGVESIVGGGGGVVSVVTVAVAAPEFPAASVTQTRIVFCPSLSELAFTVVETPPEAV